MLELLALLDDAPDEFKEKAKMAILGVVEEYEDWVACGRPDFDEYQLIRYARADLGEGALKFQEFVRKYLLKKPE